MARPPIPRVALWEILALLTAVSLIGAVATYVAVADSSHSVLQVIGLFVPTVLLAFLTLWLRARAKRR